MAMGYGVVLYQQQLDSALSRQQQASEWLTSRIEAELEGFGSRLVSSHRRLSALLEPPGLTPPSEVLKRQIQPLLLSLLDSEVAFVQALLLSPEGDVLAGVKREQGKVLTLSRDEERVLLSLAHVAGRGEVRAGQLSPALSTVSIVGAEKPGEGLSFAMILADGSPLATQLVVAVDVASQWLAKLPLSNPVAGLGGRNYLIDSATRLVVPAPGSSFQVGDVLTYLRADHSLPSASLWSLETVYDSAVGGPVYACHIPIPALGWTLVSEVPKSSVLQLIWPPLVMLLLFSSVLVLLIIGFVLRLMNRFLRPFKAAREAIEKISEGDYQLSLKPVGIFEIDEMTASIVHMARVREGAEQALSKSRQDLLVTLRSIGDAVITCDKQGLVTRMNPVAEVLTGWPMEEAVGKAIKKIFNIVDASTHEPIANPVDKVLRSGETVYLSNDTTLIARDGREYHIADSAAPIRAEDNKILGMVLVFNDVSEAYLLRQKAVLAQEELQALLADMHTMVCITEPDGTAIFANNTSLQASGARLDEIQGKKLWDCIWFEGSTRLQGQIAKYCAEAKAGESIQKDIQINVLGGMLWVDYSMHPMLNEAGQVVKIMHEGRDISGRKTMEDEARAAAQHLELYREQTPLAAIEWDSEIHVVDWNDAAEQMFGYRLDEIKGRNITGLLISEEDAVLASKIFQGLDTYGESRTSRSHTRTKDGREIVCEWHNTLLKNEKDETIGAASVVLDITAQQKAQQALLLKEREQSDILNCMVDAVITIDESGKVLSANKMAETLFGYRADELVGNNVSLLMPAGVAAEHDAYIQRYLQTGEARVIGRGAEVDGRHKNAQSFPLRLQIAELPGDSSGLRRFIGSCHDLSKTKLQDEQLRRSYKMDALGKLTGGVAHDFNNILGVVTGYADLLESMLGEQPKLANYAHEINHAGQRGAKLTQKLLSFSRQGATSAAKVDIRALLRGQQDMLQKTLTVSIELVVECAAEVWPVWLDASDLEDAVLNMSINAMHAMEEVAAARLTISAANLSLNTFDASTLGLPRGGDYVELRIVDTGTGMDDVTREQIFDPFFSTKGEKGTGLGLSQVFGFVSRGGGGIKVYSELGHGSEFVLYFPRYLGASVIAEAESLAYGDAPGGGEQILVVDDEEALRELATELLSQKGYRVRRAANAQQALQIMQTASFDVLLSDLIMPGMNGYQLAGKVRERYPTTKILLASGFADERNLEGIDQQLHAQMLHKPYNSRILFKAIRELLDGD